MGGLAASEIRALNRILEELDYYQMLEVPREAPASAIRAAYHSISRRIHPDANRGLDSDARAAAERIARRVAEAYSVLRDARRRQVYDRRLAAGERVSRMPLVEAEAEAERQASAELGGRTPNGRRYFALACADLSRGDRGAAERNVRTALAFEPDNTLFQQKLVEIRRGSR